MVKRLIHQIARKSRKFRQALDEVYQSRKAERWERNWHRYFAAGETIRTSPKRQY